jgi:hypothetical protein
VSGPAATVGDAREAGKMVRHRMPSAACQMVFQPAPEELQEILLFVKLHNVGEYSKLLLEGKKSGRLSEFD